MSPCGSNITIFIQRPRKSEMARPSQSHDVPWVIPGVFIESVRFLHGAPLGKLAGISKRCRGTYPTPSNPRPKLAHALQVCKVRFLFRLRSLAPTGVRVGRNRAVHVDVGRHKHAEPRVWGDHGSFRGFQLGQNASNALGCGEKPIECIVAFKRAPSDACQDAIAVEEQYTTGLTKTHRGG